jgi:NAD-dependent dihydropyrimidine dehydrogenase PreA subunit
MLGGHLDFVRHFGFFAPIVDICRISLVEKNTSDHCKKKKFGHIQWITCFGMTGCMSTTPTAAMKTL